MTDDTPLGKRETPAGRIRRLADALNVSMTLDSTLRIFSTGTRVEIRPANGHTGDPGIDTVAEFQSAFCCYVGDEPEVPEYLAESHSVIQGYARTAAASAESLKLAAVEAKERGDEGGALLLIRLQLCQEELAELAQAIADGDIVECLDALTDMTYVADGTYLTLGLGHYKLSALAEVHRSNMSKLDADGKPIISDAGRVVKGPNYTRPNLKEVLGLE